MPEGAVFAHRARGQDHGHRQEQEAAGHRCMMSRASPGRPCQRLPLARARVAEPGRRAGLRSRCPKGRGGSNPPSRTSLAGAELTQLGSAKSGARPASRDPPLGYPHPDGRSLRSRGTPRSGISSAARRACPKKSTSSSATQMRHRDVHVPRSSLTAPSAIAARHAARIACRVTCQVHLPHRSGYRPMIASNASTSATMPCFLEAASASPTTRASGPSGSIS